MIIARNGLDPFERSLSTVSSWFFFTDPATDTQKTRNYRNSVVGGNRFWRRTKKNPTNGGKKTMLCGNQNQTISPCTAGTETRPYFAKVVYPLIYINIYIHIYIYVQGQRVIWFGEGRVILLRGGKTGNLQTHYSLLGRH